MSLASATLLKACGTNYVPGNGDRIYLVQKGDITTFASNSASSTPAETKTFDTAFTLASGKRWMEVDCLVNTVEGIDAVQGEIGGQFIRNTFVAFVPGYAAAHRAFLDEMVANSGCLIVLHVSKGGTVSIVGNLANPCYVESASGGGGGPENARVGVAYRFYADTGYAAPVYTGAIDLTA